MAKKLYTHQQIRKSLKRDELRDLTEKTIHFAKTHTENILISLGVLAVIAFLVPLYFNHLETSERRAAGMYNTAVSHYLQPLAGQSAAVGAELFRTREEKYKKTQQSFAEVAGTYKNTQAGKMARLGQANSLFFQQKYDEAQALYRQELPNHEGAMGVTIRMRIAQCMESSGKFKEAMDEYQQMLQQDPENFSRQAGRLGLARCQIKLGQNAEAEKILKEIAAADPGSYWSETARRQMAWLSYSAASVAGPGNSTK